ncbi:hypothetical protein E1B28_012576 [Marasmius oreades]|uniref:Uncharacterized protein n=1 Tax=Marasmius oreades TaxID=181124 RepID=A0A9P7RS10_9AGAR|nr:uncharacterized protein E1B28_012576 [Marasmius oreades]KAG7088602.1 hypothetical protein E1B28_012576 [Marasmius oreades]
MAQKTIPESDEFEDIDEFAHWTQADFDFLDAQLASPKVQGLPQVPVELDFGLFGLDSTMLKPSSSRLLPPHLSSRTGSALSPNSPLQRFRRTRHLSVTDLVSPAWCEYQFDYGLRQGRHKKLSERPDSFVTKAGEEIQVDKTIAVKNEVQLDRGKAVHKKLEREIRPEDVIVPVDTKEDGWGLRLLNMITGFQTLLQMGCAREFPVFGIVEGHVVIGVIDEIITTKAGRDMPSSSSKRPSSNSNTPRKPKRSRTSPGILTREASHNSTKLKSVVSLASVSLDRVRQTSSPEEHYILHLNDTKTRRSNTLPSDDDTLSSRLQLMMYHRLLSNLLAKFDFSTLWNKLEVNPSQKFSQTFLSEAGLGELASYEIGCLDDLTALWHAKLLDLRIAHVDARLTLVYRSQQSLRNEQREGEGKAGDKTPELEFISPQEQMDIARAIEASLQDLVATGEPFAALDKTGLPESVPLDDPDDGFQWTQHQSHLRRLNRITSRTEGEISRDQRHKDQASGVHAIGKSSDTKDETDANIIGTKDFLYSASFLDNHIRDVMRWWEGYREPRGVSLEQAWRCS